MDFLLGAKKIIQEYWNLLKTQILRQQSNWQRKEREREEAEAGRTSRPASPIAPEKQIASALFHFNQKEPEDWSTPGFLKDEAARVEELSPQVDPVPAPAPPEDHSQRSQTYVTNFPNSLSPRSKEPARSRRGTGTSPSRRSRSTSPASPLESPPPLELPRLEKEKEERSWSEAIKQAQAGNLPDLPDLEEMDIDLHVSDSEIETLLK
jgi:hypothetical protein